MIDLVMTVLFLSGATSEQYVETLVGEHPYSGARTLL